MANVVLITGRVVRDPDIRSTAGQNPNTVARFTLAVPRRSKDKTADFIDCTAFGKTAEFVEKWFHKGYAMEVHGRITKETFKDKDGNNRSAVYVIADDVNFVLGAPKADEGKQTVQMPSQAPKTASGDLDPDWSNIPDGIDESELPFGG